ncbi:hypothetical protein GURASL_28680 [Geotalea uraniireducens]|uniref:Uncharacterized protein n=1 Tax=Geotalea uraniireducens TaxID=351604 RepID=A0ABM8EP03_9BACT|nr:hypothetical protein GURASL_28680 [Geotalea uraniireducens]
MGSAIADAPGSGNGLASCGNMAVGENAANGSPARKILQQWHVFTHIVPDVAGKANCMALFLPGGCSSADTYQLAKFNAYFVMCKRLIF